MLAALPVNVDMLMETFFCILPLKEYCLIAFLSKDVLLKDKEDILYVM